MSKTWTGALPPESPFYDGQIGFSDHARERWAERTGPDAPAIEDGWAQAERLSTRVTSGWQGDEYRVHESQQVVLARCGDTITTALALTGPDAHRWLQSAVYSDVGRCWPSAEDLVGGGSDGA